MLKTIISSVTAAGFLLTAPIVFAAGVACSVTNAASAVCVDSATGATPPAMVKFDMSGTNLYVTLSYTSLDGGHSPADALTAVYFTLTNPNTFQSINLGAGSTVKRLTVGGEDWALRNATLPDDGAASRIANAATGLGLFAPSDDPAPAIFTASAASVPTTHQIKFRVGGSLPAGFNFNTPGSLASVTFQHESPSIEPQVPEPSTYLLFAIGLFGLLISVRSRRFPA